MTIDLNISLETEAKIRDLAAAAGQDVETFVIQVLTEKLAEPEPATPVQFGREWKAKLQACIDLHPIASHWVDDSRESIYAER